MGDLQLQCEINQIIVIMCEINQIIVITCEINQIIAIMCEILYQLCVKYCTNTHTHIPQYCKLNFGGTKVWWD